MCQALRTLDTGRRMSLSVCRDSCHVCLGAPFARSPLGLCVKINCPALHLISITLTTQFLSTMQAMAEANHMEFAVSTGGPMAPPETDAQPLEPSSSAAKSRGRARKNSKQALPTLSTCTFSHLPVTIYPSLHCIFAFCVALCSPSVFRMRLSVTSVSSLVPGASRHELSATPISLHAPRRTVLVCARLMCCSFCAFWSLQLHASHRCCETQASTCN